MTEHFRWIAVITYRSEHGPVEVEHHLEEIESLHNLVEFGPDWHTIEGIAIRLNPHRNYYPGDTAEAAERR